MAVDVVASSPREPADATRRAGLLATVVAFLIWGLLPLYLRPLRDVPPLEVMSHRIVWSCVLVIGYLAVHGGLGDVRRALIDPKTRWRLMLTATLVSINWLGFVYAASIGRVLDASLGYFINPLVNVLLGVLLLSERLSPLRWVATALAAAGVIWLTIAAGELPWIALLLASSFAAYGFIRKVVAVEAVVGLAAETLMLAPLAVAYLGWALEGGHARVTLTEPARFAWLMFGGPMTAVPLALFAFGARRIPYSTVGLIQYLGPTLQFVCGVFVFGEAFSATKLIGFGAIWLALAVFAADGLRKPR